jgi:hypothetical protein
VKSMLCYFGGGAPTQCPSGEESSASHAGHGGNSELMRKLGFLSSSEVVADDLDHYAKLFIEGLLEEEVSMIQDLFMHHVRSRSRRR